MSLARLDDHSITQLDDQTRIRLADINKVSTTGPGNYATA